MLRIMQLGLMVLLSGCASVQLAQLSGHVTYRERIALPPETELRVALEDVSVADAPQYIFGVSRSGVDIYVELGASPAARESLKRAIAPLLGNFGSSSRAFVRSLIR